MSTATPARAAPLTSAALGRLNLTVAGVVLIFFFIYGSVVTCVVRAQHCTSRVLQLPKQTQVSLCKMCFLQANTWQTRLPITKRKHARLAYHQAQARTPSAATLRALAAAQRPPCLSR
jgi:hypothetical protein